ncbi:hypothetical protein QMG83_12135 [Salinibacterium sp. G-O1]|uniref:hypothetical protein n=1 Tax=Salinibacterium sp. G-O1 TaxID=3046208 RepID=UPI0024B91A90|nr:hypothetical protein [Salinibacterium sp. G-O1]MDJ0335975.1 hypothetical protein [Salinibacterium sp. G-O1]
MSGHNIVHLIREVDATSHEDIPSRLKAARARRAARSAAIAASTVAALGLILAGGSVILTTIHEQWNASLTLATVGAAFLLLGLSGGPLLRGLAVARLRRSRPDALVFMALRETTGHPNLQTYQHRKDNTANVPEGWTVSVVDSRGIAVWSGGFRPRELILIEWSEIGEVSAVSFTSAAGRPRNGASVDVRPFPDPLLVRVGHAAFGVEGSFDRKGIFAIVDTLNALR